MSRQQIWAEEMSRSHSRIESPISLRVSAEWLEAIDRWREQQLVKPSRSAVIVAAVEQFIAAKKADGEGET